MIIKMIEVYPYPTYGFWNMLGIGLFIFLCLSGMGIHAYLKYKGYADLIKNLEKEDEKI